MEIDPNVRAAADRLKAAKEEQAILTALQELLRFADDMDGTWICVLYSAENR